VPRTSARTSSQHIAFRWPNLPLNLAAQSAIVFISSYKEKLLAVSSQPSACAATAPRFVRKAGALTLREVLWHLERSRQHLALSYWLACRLRAAIPPPYMRKNTGRSFAHLRREAENFQHWPNRVCFDQNVRSSRGIRILSPKNRVCTVGTEYQAD
jgi:hypothetical protein